MIKESGVMSAMCSRHEANTLEISSCEPKSDGRTARRHHQIDNGVDLNQKRKPGIGMIGQNNKNKEKHAQLSSPCRSEDGSLPCCTILESMTDGVFTVNLERRINTYFNRAAEEITGFTFQEAVNQFCFDILRSSTCQTNCPLERTLKTGKPVYNHPAVIITKAGKEIPVSVTTALVRNLTGEVVGAMEIFRDLSVIETLRKAVADFLPRAIVGRRKRGLRAPTAAWLRAPLPDFAAELLAETALREKGYFDPACVRRLLAEHRSGRHERTAELISVLCLQLWDEMFIRGRRP